MVRWRKLVEELVKSPKSVVRRCAIPKNTIGPPILVIFTDGSFTAFGAVIYVVYEVEVSEAGPRAEDLGQKKHFAPSLLLLKARVAPLAGITTPRSEMNGVVLGIKLVELSLRSMAELPSRVIFGLDSECTIVAVDSENSILKAYLDDRRATLLNAIRNSRERYQSVEIEDFQHLAGPLNLADLATRSL